MTKRISITIPKDLDKRLSDYCRDTVRKKSTVIAHAIRLYLESTGGKTVSDTPEEAMP